MRYWKFINPDGSTNSVQSLSNDAHEVPNAVEIDQAEFDEYLASLPKPIAEKPRDLAAEVDDLKTRVSKLE